MKLDSTTRIKTVL